MKKQKGLVFALVFKILLVFKTIFILSIQTADSLQLVPLLLYLTSLDKNTGYNSPSSDTFCSFLGDSNNERRTNKATATIGLVVHAAGMVITIYLL